jgi:Reticulon
MSNLPRAPTFPAVSDVGEAVTTIDDEPYSTSTATPSASTYHTPAKSAPLGRMQTDTSTPARGAGAASRSKLRGVLTWKDPKVSAAALAACLVFFYFTLWKGYSILSVCGGGVALYLCLGLVLVNVNKIVLGGSLDRFVKRPANPAPMFSKAAAYRFADVFVEEGNEFAEDVRDVMYCDHTALTVTYIVLALFVYVVGKSFSLLPVFFVFTLFAFTLPIAYEKNKKAVDGGIAQASAVASKHLESGRKVVVARSYQFKDMAAEKSAPYLEKAPAVKNLANKVGFTPSKKAM